MPEAFVGNKTEVPGGMPILAWVDRVRDYEVEMECDRFTAKLHVWREVTGDWPEDVSTWWEIRQARKRGEIEHTTETTPATVDGEGIVYCGYCRARWSSRDDRCGLCDRVFEYDEEMMAENKLIERIKRDEGVSTHDAIRMARSGDYDDEQEADNDD